MLMAYLALISGLLISAVAIYYSVAGLTSVFAAAVVPVIIMGTSLEIGKLVATVWVKQNWNTAPKLLRYPLLSMVVVLMLITSMGTFGYLSKAHMDQSLVSGDAQSKIAVYDEKIKTARDNIEANRKALKQMDEAVDQSMARSTDEKGADKAVAIRRGQQKERARLLAEITSEQKAISQLNEERAPIAAEVRKVEAEVGPIKYVAAFLYGDNPDQNILDKAVRAVIVLIVVAFDPLAVLLLLASQYSFAAIRNPKPKEEPKEVPNFIEQMWDPLAKIRAKFTKEGPAEVPKGPPEFEGIKVNGEWVQTGPIIEAHAPTEEPVTLDYVNQQLAEAAVVKEFEEPVIEEPAVEEPKIEYKVLDDISDEEYVLVPTPHITNTDNPIDFPKEPEGKYQIIPELQEELNKEETPVVINTATELTPPAFGYYEVMHTDNGVILKDKDGGETHIPLEIKEEPTYIQNEEQQEGGIWQKIQHPITEEEYIKKAQEELKKKD
jgi:hypothetical protein